MNFTNEVFQKKYSRHLKELKEQKLYMMIILHGAKMKIAIIKKSEMYLRGPERNV